MKAAAATLLALIAATVLVAWRYAPPPPVPASAPPTEFSAGRARATLARILGDEAAASGARPHPTGSAANAAVRARLVGELAALGLRPFVETRFACSAVRCATVSNVLAWLRGEDSAAPFVLLATHYDSVAAGAGASDDGAGVAALVEAARALCAGPRLRHDVLLLADDGEEQGLLGAEAFVLDRARLARVAAVVNLEARGTTGPSLMFELSPGNARLVGAASRALRRPATDSIFYALYQRLPNDTDLTVFEREGLPGVNFAFVGGALRYHTPRDDLAHLDLGSLQQHGDAAVAMLRALAGAASWRAAGDAVFFDVLTLGVVRWPEPWTVPLAVIALAIVLVATFLGRRRVAALGIPRAALAFAGAIVAALLLGVVLQLLLRAIGALPYTWIASGGALRAAAWAAGAAGVLLVAAAAGERLTAGGAWSAVWMGYGALAVAAAALAPSMSYPLVAPALVAAVSALVTGIAHRAPAAWSALAPSVALALLVLPFAWLLLDGMGAPALPGLSLLVAIVLASALPALAGIPARARLGLAGVALAVLVIAIVIVVVAPRFTDDAPAPASLVLVHDADAHVTRWVVPSSGALRPPFGTFDRAPVAVYPWTSSPSWAAPGPSLSLAPPELVVESSTREGDRLRVRARLRSPRGATIGGVVVGDGALLAAAIDGVSLHWPPRRGSGDLGWVEDVTLPAAGAQIELLLRADRPIAAWVWDQGTSATWAGSPAGPPRPSWAVPIGRGDRDMVFRRVDVSRAVSQGVAGSM